MQFSIRNILSQSLGIVLSHWLRVVAIIAAFSAFFGGVFYFIHERTDQDGFFNAIKNGTLDSYQPSEPDGVLVFMFLLLFPLLGLSIVALFNYFVRFGALGPMQAYSGSVGKTFSASFVNGIKFLFIFILLSLVMMVVLAVLSAFSGGIEGMAEGFMQNVLDSLEKGLSLSLLLKLIIFNLIIMIVMSLTYAFFSANLTKTALGDNVSEYETPHIVDFAVVLLIVYIVSAIPQFLVPQAKLVDGVLVSPSGVYYIIMSSLSIVTQILAFVVIAVAHGVRHRMCAPVEADITYQSMAASNEEVSQEQDDEQDPPQAGPNS